MMMMMMMMMMMIADDDDDDDDDDCSWWWWWLQSLVVLRTIDSYNYYTFVNLWLVHQCTCDACACDSCACDSCACDSCACDLWLMHLWLMYLRLMHPCHRSTCDSYLSSCFLISSIRPFETRLNGRWSASWPSLTRDSWSVTDVVYDCQLRTPERTLNWRNHRPSALPVVPTIQKSRRSDWT